MSRADDWKPHNDALRVAETIQAQLGHKALVMMGATNLVAMADGFKFKIKGCLIGNLLLINLTPADTYNVSLWSIRGAHTHCSARTDDVQVGELHATIERMTGLYLSLGTMLGKA